MARVLITEDDERVRQTLIDVLVRAGHEVVGASSGRRALEVLSHWPVDLIITDVYMPEMDGIELLFSLRQTHAALPVVVISGGGSRGSGGDVLESLELVGATRVLRKPLDIERLLAMVGELSACSW